MTLGQIAPSQSGFNGTAMLTHEQQMRGNLANQYGNIGGVINGDKIIFDIEWTRRDGSRLKGHYEGDLTTGGIINGVCWDTSNPSKTAKWQATGPAHQ